MALASGIIEVWKGSKKIESGPAVDLFANPNEHETQYDFLNRLGLQLYLDGNAHIMPEIGPRSKWPMRLLLLPPGWVQAIDDPWNPYGLRGWRVRYARREYGPAELIHVKYANDPVLPYRGVSPLGPSFLAAQADWDSALHISSLLQNNAVPPLILTNTKDPPLGEKELDEAERRWEENSAGSRNAGRVRFLNNEWNAQELAFSPKNLLLFEGRETYLEEIARGMGTQLVLLQVYPQGGLSQAGVLPYWKIQYTNETLPLGSRIEQRLTLIARMFDDDYTVVLNYDHLEALRQGQSEKLDQAAKYRELGLTRNEAEDIVQLGMPKTPSGDVVLVPVGQTTLDAILAEASLLSEAGTDGGAGEDEGLNEPPGALQLSDAQRVDVIAIVAKVASDEIPRDAGIGLLVKLLGLTPEQAEEVMGSAGQDDAAAPAKDPADEGEARPPVPPLDLDAEGRSRAAAIGDGKAIRARISERYDKLATKRENAMFRSIRTNLLKQKRRIRSALAKGTRSYLLRKEGDEPPDWLTGAPDAFDEKAFLASIEVEFVPTYREGAGQAQKLLKDVGIVDEGNIDYALGRPEINKIAKVLWDKRIGQLVHTSDRIKTKVRDSLVEGWNKGESLADLLKRVESSMTASLIRARRIARHETQEALEGAADARYQAVAGDDDNVEFEWVTAGDEAEGRVRPSHRIDGERRKLGDLYSNGLERPMDPSADISETAGCRCTRRPVVKGLSG